MRTNFAAQRANLPAQMDRCARGHVLPDGLSPERSPGPQACEHHGVTHRWYRCRMRAGAGACSDLVVVPQIEMVWTGGESKVCYLAGRDREERR